MNYTQNFKEAIKLNTYLGTGEPNSQILIIGKEVSTDIEETNNKELENQNLHNFNNNCNDWLENEKKNIHQIDIPKWQVGQESNNPLYAFKGVDIKEEGHTWRKYQKLNNYIFDKKDNKEINFQEYFFITEMNILPAKTTRKAQKKADFNTNLKKRKTTFLKSKFIQDFPIVILACGNYIKGEEITSIFNVDFVEEKGTEKQRYWIHWNSEKTKLLIHTRQLSGNVTNDLLLSIANEVKKILK